MPLMNRNSIKALLLNEDHELLLMCAEDPKTTTLDGKGHNHFWSLIGGEIESGESIQEAILREIHEETGITSNKIKLGSVVWFGKFDLILFGKPTHVKQSFVVAKTTQRNFSLANLTKEEQPIIKKLKWFSLKEIKECPDVIYPVLLPKYLPDVISGKYPKEPLEIDLGKQPD